MSRPPEVEAAMSYRNGPLSCVLTMSDGSKRYGHEILAAEVERLEKREKELEADLDAYAPPVLQDGRPILDSFGSKLRRDVRARAEAAEARVAELRAQNARLRAEVEGAQSDRQQVEAERQRLVLRVGVLSEQATARAEISTKLRRALAACLAYLMRRLKALTLNGSASDGTQALAREVSEALDEAKALNGEEAST